MLRNVKSDKNFEILTSSHQRVIVVVFVLIRLVQDERSTNYPYTSNDNLFHKLIP